MSDEPGICPDCPRKPLLPLVRNISWTNTPTPDSTIKLCAKLRAMDTHLPQCPYFSEQLDSFLGIPEKALDKLRRETNELEKKLNEMTHGDFYAPFTCRGLETYRPREIEQLLLKHPEIKETLREAIIKHLEFYKAFYKCPLDEIAQDTSVSNILSLHRNFPEPFSLAAYTKTKR